MQKKEKEKEKNETGKQKGSWNWFTFVKLGKLWLKADLRQRYRLASSCALLREKMPSNRALWMSGIRSSLLSWESAVLADLADSVALGRSVSLPTWGRLSSNPSFAHLFLLTFYQTGLEGKKRKREEVGLREGVHTFTFLGITFVFREM